MPESRSKTRSSARRIAPAGPRVSPGGVARLYLLLLTGAFCVGCDPYTQTRIKNDTAGPVEVELTLDRTQWHHGFEPEEYQQWLSERTDEWIEGELQVYLASEGVELVDVDAARFAGKYQLEPSALLIMHEGMGTGPYHYLSKLIVKKGDQTRTFTGTDEIRELFEPVEGNLWEFRISDAL